MTSKALRLPAVIEKTGLSRSSIYRLLQERKLPSPVKLSALSAGWFEGSVNPWLSALTENAGA